MFGIPPAADRYLISDQGDRTWMMRLVERTVCRFLDHRTSVLAYDAFDVVEVFDQDEEEWFTTVEERDEPFIGCMRCLAEVSIDRRPPVPVDIVDWA